MGRDPQHRDFNLFRCADLLKRPADLRRRFAAIPFVNGGLFDCLDGFAAGGDREDRRRIDCFTDNPVHRKLLKVPSRLFFAEDGGLFPLLNQFKFTVAENTPLDQEVALDPELLGLVFENLLAAIVPESRDNARKETGSFYTPRPIVDHMVDEALAAHLAGRLGKNSEARLRALLSWEDPADDSFSEKEKDALIAAIDGLRTLDPAVGSGAFPMGMLHKLVHILSRADPQNAKWKKIQQARAAEIPDPAVRRDALENIGRVFSEANNYGDYGRKLYLIQRVIHGADLQPAAAQIARLRFFISLVIDQKPREDRPNRGIEPLPNLETKFLRRHRRLLHLLLPQGVVGVARGRALVPHHLQQFHARGFRKEPARVFGETIRNANHRGFWGSSPDERHDPPRHHCRQESRAVRGGLFARRHRQGRVGHFSLA